MASMIAHWAAASSSTPSAAATAHASASAVLEARAPGRDRHGAARPRGRSPPSPPRAPRAAPPSPRGRRARRRRRRPRSRERGAARARRRAPSVELARRGADDGVAGASAGRRLPARARTASTPADAPGRRRRCRVGAEPRRARIASTCSRPFEQREDDGSGERLGRDPVEGAVEVVGLHRDHEQRRRASRAARRPRDARRSSSSPWTSVSPALADRRRPSARYRRRARPCARRACRRSPPRPSTAIGRVTSSAGSTTRLTYCVSE